MVLMSRLDASLRAGDTSGSAVRILWRVLATLVIATMLARWLWVLFAPQAISVRPAVLISSASRSETLFGHAAPAPVATSILPNVRLIGVFAPKFAVLELDGNRQIGLATGLEVVPGTRLVEVTKDYAVIERSGLRQQIPMAKNTLSVDALKTPIPSAPPNSIGQIKPQELKIEPHELKPPAESATP